MEDVADLHEKNPDFRADDWLFKLWPVTCLIALLVMLVGLPFWVLGRTTKLITRGAYGSSLELPFDLGVILLVVVSMGNLVGAFNEAAAELDEEFGQSGPEFYHCETCEEFPTPVDVDAVHSPKTGTVGVCDECDSLLWARNHHIYWWDRMEEKRDD